MAKGKRTCRILREIRRQIAEVNGIDYVTQECSYTGDCTGTCPKCESEVRWLERQLQAKALAGRAVALAGISAGLLMPGFGSSAIAKSSDSFLSSMETPSKNNEIRHPSVETQEDERSRAVQEAVVVGGVDDTMFEFDKHAEFPGGIDALFNFIMETVEYPEEARKEDIEGRVIVKFIIDETGLVKYAAIVKGVHPLLDHEALRVVGKLPRFIPAEYKGKTKSSYFSLPINFRLSEIYGDNDSKSSDE